jgi:UDPglucose 6-dehydrogenase
MQVAVVGLGYVGLVTATCLARLGQDVVGLEVDGEKLAALQLGEAPYYEPHLQPELTQQQRDGRLRFTLDPGEAFAGTDVILICVGTPSQPDGGADLAAVRSVTETIGSHLQNPTPGDCLGRWR